MNKKLTEILIKLSLVILVVIFITLMLIKRFVYFKPSSHFLPTKETYKVVRHNHLHGWLLEAESDSIILLCHGNTGNISHCENKIVALHNLGYSVLAFDYSGYGKSSGIPNEQQLYDDASTMVALIRQTYSPDKIILYGESLGAPIATYVARRYSISILILESPLPSVKLLIENKFPLWQIYSFLFPEFDTAAYLKGYKGKSLVMHSPTDQIIPYTSATNIFQMCNHHIQLDGSHNNLIIPWNQIKEFIESGLNN